MQIISAKLYIEKWITYKNIWGYTRNRYYCFVCVICGRLIVFLYANWLSTLACYSPADSADYAEEYSKLYYYAEKDRLEIVLFWGLGFVCDYQRDLRETLGFLLSTLACLFSRRWRRSRRRIQQAVLFRREIRLDYSSYWGLFGDCLSTLACLFSRR